MSEPVVSRPACDRCERDTEDALLGAMMALRRGNPDDLSQSIAMLRADLRQRGTQHADPRGVKRAFIAISMALQGGGEHRE